MRANWLKARPSSYDGALRFWPGSSHCIRAALRVADAGVELIGLSDHRPKDKFGVAGGYAGVSSRARALDGDFQQMFGPTWPVRSFEFLVTAVYQYEVKPGWTLQPNFQYITHPGGGATNPLGSNPGKVLKDAAVFGLRTVLEF